MDEYLLKSNQSLIFYDIVLIIYQQKYIFILNYACLKNKT